MLHFSTRSFRIMSNYRHIFCNNAIFNAEPLIFQSNIEETLRKKLFPPCTMHTVRADCGMRYFVRGPQLYFKVRLSVYLLSAVDRCFPDVLDDIKIILLLRSSLL